MPMEGMEPSKFWSEPRCQRHGWWLLLVLTLILYLPGTATVPLMDRDEPRFAHATVEMVERGSWAIPYFNGEYRFDKPPLTYWWMRAHYALFGVNELAARLHSVVAAFLTALVVGGLVRSLSGSARAALFGGVAWLTSLQTLVHGRLCVADMPMILFMTLACRALVELLATSQENQSTKHSRLWFWTLWLSMGAGFLAKGPIAWFVPALTLALWRWVFWKKPLPWQRLKLVPGSALVLTMVAAWGIPALIETDGAFWQVGMGEHVVKRGTDVFNGRKFVPGFYLLTTWLSLFPWLGFALPVWRNLRSNWTAQTTFLAAWFVAPQLIFFFYATQLPHYVMPGYPALIVLLAMTWIQREKAPSIPGAAKWLTLFFMVIVAAGWTLALMCEIDQAVLRELLISALWVLTSVLAVGGVAALMVWKQSLRGSAAIMACAAVILTSVSLIALGRNLRTASVPLVVAKHLGTLPARMTLHGCGYTEPSLVFYTNHKWHYTDDMAAAQQFLAKPGPVAVVMMKREWTLDRWFKGMMIATPSGKPAKDHSAWVNDLLKQTPGVKSIAIEGFNAARFSWAEVVLLIKR